MDNQSDTQLRSAADLLKEKKPRSPHGRTALFLVALLLVAGGAYWGIRNARPLQNVSQQEIFSGYISREALPASPSGADPYDYGLADAPGEAAKPSGYLFFTAIRNGVEGMHEWLIDFSATSSDPQIRQFLPKLPTSGMIEFENAATPSGTFYLSVISSSSRKYEDRDPLGIHRFNADGSADYFTAAASKLERDLALSPEKLRLAYTHLNTAALPADMYLIKNWDTPIIDVRDNTIIDLIQGAVQPKWSPDGTKLLVMKQDGLYAYTLATKKEERVIAAPEGQEMLTSNMFDVSRDGKKLIMTVPKQGVIIVSNITSWEPFVVQEVGRIHTDATEYYWPQFSSDGRFYAVQAIKGGGTTVERSDPRMEIRSVYGRSVLSTVPLGDFDFNVLFTDTWTPILPELGVQSATTTGE